MGLRQTLTVVLLFMLFAGISAWLQFGLLARSADSAPAHSAAAAAAQPDYSIENLVSTGVDQRGEKYRLSAERLTHYPGERRAVLECPHFIHYPSSGAPRHLYADTGWLDDDGAKVLLSGNVRGVQGGGIGGGDDDDAAAATGPCVATGEPKKWTRRQDPVRASGG